MRQSGVPTGHCAHLQPRPASPPGSLCGKARYESSPGRVGTDRRRHAVSQPLRSRCSWGEANDSGTLRGVRPGPDSGLGPVLQDGRPPRFESHILITLGSRTHLPAGKWVGGEGFVEPSASVLPERAQAPVLTSPQSGRWGDPFTTRHCQSAFRRPRPGAPLERGALGGATKHTGACPQRSHVGAGRRCTDLGAERD